MNGLIVSRPANKSKAGSGTKYYDMSLPSTGDQIYKCGTHNFETRNLREFNRHVEDHGSKAASVTEVLNGMICSKAAATTKEPEIIDLQRSASIHGINKMKAIQEFINRKH